MKISYITPTCQRENYLKHFYVEVVSKQRFVGDWEWLILDNSVTPSLFFASLRDKRVRYVHDGNIVTIGEKRNRLLDLCDGDVIIHFDDDDYYSPDYTRIVLSRLNDADLCKLYAWFVYDTTADQYYYVNTRDSSVAHFMLDPSSGSKAQVLEFSEAETASFNASACEGYGFSFAYKRSVAKSCRFEPCNRAEDVRFFAIAKEKGYWPNYLADEEGIAIHIMHDSNTAREFRNFDFLLFWERVYFQISLRICADIPDRPVVKTYFQS